MSDSKQPSSAPEGFKFLPGQKLLKLVSPREPPALPIAQCFVTAGLKRPKRLVFRHCSFGRMCPHRPELAALGCAFSTDPCLSSSFQRALLPAPSGHPPCDIQRTTSHILLPGHSSGGLCATLLFVAQLSSTVSLISLQN